MKKPVKRVKRVKRVKKVSQNERDRKLMAEHLSKIMLCIDRMENDRRINQSNVARDLAIVAAAIGRIENAQRELNLAGWSNRMGNKLEVIQERMARIDWVHLMLAKVIAPLLHGTREEREDAYAYIPSHYVEEINAMAHQADRVGIDG